MHIGSLGHLGLLGVRAGRGGWALRRQRLVPRPPLFDVGHGDVRKRCLVHLRIQPVNGVLQPLGSDDLHVHVLLSERLLDDDEEDVAGGVGSPMRSLSAAPRALASHGLVLGLQVGSSPPPVLRLSFRLRFSHRPSPENILLLFLAANVSVLSFLSFALLLQLLLLPGQEPLLGLLANCLEELRLRGARPGLLLLLLALRQLLHLAFLLRLPARHVLRLRLCFAAVGLHLHLPLGRLPLGFVLRLHQTQVDALPAGAPHVHGHPNVLVLGRVVASVPPVAPASGGFVDRPAQRPL
mmetsp:Transcript_44064/g.84206  ORF Transcript_44064/g.84206 Transcript_44064/m.84206 type:complete len:295 (-) Transcript_44064:1057-1941(-)